RHVPQGGAMSDGALIVAYLVAGVLFIRSLGGLSKQETARRGNLYGMLGMAIAVVATALQPSVSSCTTMHAALHGGTAIVAIGALAHTLQQQGWDDTTMGAARRGGAAIGAIVARRVAMTAMPELVAILHSFVGLAAVLVGVSTYLEPGRELAGVAHTIHLGE